MAETNYSILMSVYSKDHPLWLKEAIDSMLNQTLKSNEFVIVKDGPLTKELDIVINQYQNEYPNIFKIISLEQNVGLGPALAKGVLACSNSFIARMDADDIADLNRCKLELDKMLENKLDVVGSMTVEFIDSIENIISIRKLPESNSEIYKFAKRRNPFCHPSIMIRKESLLLAGNYRKFHLCEDYDLWVRMFCNNAKCYNFQIPLTYMRINKEFYARRGGIKYLKSILKFKYFCYRIKFFSFNDFFISSLASTIVCIIPSSLREIIYKKLLRGGGKHDKNFASCSKYE